MTAVPPDVSLRPYNDGDFGLLRAILGDPDMTRFLGGPESDEALAARHARYVSADPLTNGLYAIALSGERRAVGWIGFWELEWAGKKTWECGWHVLPAFQGRGIAVTAGMAMLDVIQTRRRHRFVNAFPSVDNRASNAVCRSLGFISLGEVEVEYPKGHMMRSVHWRYDLQPPGQQDFGLHAIHVKPTQGGRC